MEKKYTLQDLSALLAERESLSPEQAEDFVRTFFELTEEGLLKDSFVKVTGFGTFKLVEVSERESVNINTGERFQISGHNKISFTPDGTLRELVNRPFAHFTTVTLNDNTPETALEAAEQTADEAPATPAKTETQVAETPSNEVDFDPIVEEKKAEKDDSTEETAVECTVPVEEATQTAPVAVEGTTVLEPNNPIREQSSEVFENLHANCGSNNIVSEETSNTCKKSKTIVDRTPAIHTEQAEKEAAQPGHIKATTDVSSTEAARVSPATSPLLQRPTPVPIIADALLVSQTPSPVLNNELLSELLTETPDTEAAIAEDSIEEEEAITPLAVESADATTAYTAVAEVDIAELVEETNDAAEEIDEVEADEEDFEEEDHDTAEEVDEVEADEEDFEEETDDDAEEVEEVEVDEEDFKEEDAENSENIAELLEQTAAEAPLMEETAEETDTIAAQDDTNAQPAHTESESAPVVLSTVAAPIIDLALSEEPSAEIAEESAPVAAETSEEAPATPVEPKPSQGPALQFVPTREALRELSEEKPATQAPTSTATALPLRDQYRYPVDFEIKHSDPTPVLPEVPVEQAVCKEEIPTATCETADAAEVLPAETTEVISEMTEALPETEEAAKTAHAEQVEIEQNSPALPSTIAAPQIDLEALETKTPSAEENLPVQTVETAIEGETPAEFFTAAEVTETETAVTETKTGVDEAEAEVSETETAVAEIATTAVETETAVNAAETEVSEAETTEEQTVDTTATPTESADETVIVAPTPLSVPLSIATAVENEEPTETKEEAPLEPTPETPDTAEKVDSPAEEAEAPPTEQPLSEEAAAKTATEQDEKSDDATTAAAATDTTGKENRERRKRRSRRRHRKRKSGEKMLGLVLLLIVLFCCAFGYLCYSRVITPKDIPSWLHPVYEFFSPEDENGLHATSGVIGSANAQSVQPVLPTPAQRAAIAKAKEDSAKAEAIAEAERAAAESKAEAERQARVKDLYARASRFPQVKDGSMLITGTHAVHKMKAGDNIYLIAERMYGSRGYAKYIIEYNNIQNPDFIKVNKVLKLPKLVNPKSIK